MSSPDRHLLAQVQPAGVTCACAKNHRPASIQFEHHHIWPQEFGGPTVPLNQKWVCATTHNTVHVYLRLFLAAGKIVSRTELKPLLVAKHYPPQIVNYAFDLAVEGYRRIKAQSI